MKITRIILSLLLAISSAITTKAYDFAYNNMYFNLNVANGTATLTYSSTSYNSYKGDIEIPEQIIGPKDIPYTVTAIGDNALRNSTSVNCILIPSTIISIGDNALMGCTSITTVSIPSSVSSLGAQAFQGCTKLRSVVLNEGLRTIGNKCFQNTVLVNVTVPNSVTTIGTYCFESSSTSPSIVTVKLGTGVKSIPDGCFKNQSSMSSISWANDLTNIGSEAFYNCRSLPGDILTNSISTIGSYAFYNTSALTSLTVPASLTSIGNNAFLESSISTLKYADGCTTTLPTYAKNTTRVVLPSSLTSIESQAFYNFSRLTDVDIPSGVESIGSKAFEGCSTLLVARIPQSVKTIGDRAFYGCSTLKTIDFPSALATIGSEAFYNCAALKKLTVPACLVSIGSNAFYNSGVSELIYEDGCKVTLRTYANNTVTVRLPSYGCEISPSTFYGFSRLTNVDIPNDISIIQSSAFRGCTALTLTHFSNNITHIDDDAFRDCSSLTSITFPQSLTKIGNNAFNGCSSFASLTVPATLQTIGTDAFSNSGVVRLVYAEGCQKTLRTYATDITTVTLPSTLTEISPYAFYNSKRLAGVVLPANVETIGENAFYGCSQLVSLTIPQKVGYIGSNAFASSGLSNLIYAEGCNTAFRTYSTNLVSVVIPATVTSLPQDAFSGCSKLDNIYISDLEMWNYLFLDKASNPIPTAHHLYFNGKILTSFVAEYGGSISRYAFANTKSLRYVNLSQSITGVRDYAFAGCSDLEAVTLGSNVRSISNNAFEGCTSLMSVRCGTGLLTIGNNAFKDCTSLNVVHFGGNETSIGSNAFDGCVDIEDLHLPSSLTTLGTASFKGCSAVTKLTIPNSVQSVPSDCFRDCKFLREVNFNNSLTTIGSHAFDGCKSLQLVDFPTTLTQISDYAFANCDSIRYIYIKDNMSSIGASAFANNIRLVGVYSNASTVPSCNSTAFTGSDLQYVNLYVPEPVISSYSSVTPWKSFASKTNISDAPKYVVGINISPSVLILREGEYGTVTTSVTPSDVTNSEVNWTSSNTDVAYISKTGAVLANNSGVTNITATAADRGGARATGLIIVDNSYKPVTRIALSETSLRMQEGKDVYIDYETYPANATYSNVTWSSSNPNVASVNASGHVTAISQGNATIQCTADDGKGALAQCQVSVTPAINPVLGDANEDEEVTVSDIAIVARMILEAMDSDGDISLYDINNDGRITVSDIAGIANLILGSGGSHGDLRLFAMSDSDVKLQINAQYQLDAIIIPHSMASSIVWSSSNEDVATVDNTGLVTAVALGTTEITASCGGQQKKCMLTVLPPALLLEDWESDNAGKASSTSSHTWTFQADGRDTLSFNYTVSSEQKYDKLTITLDGITIVSGVSGEVSSSYKKVLSQGSHTLVAKYTKDGSDNKGSDKATVTNVKVARESTSNSQTGNNGHEYVDLGLSVKWATCNVGATAPEDYGDYFAWGETSPKSTYNWSSYKWCNGSYDTLTKYCTSSDFGTVDNKTTLESSDDAATVNWGGSWRMPTKAEQDELRTKCTWTWTTQNGVKGYKVTGPNGNFIFLPAAGERHDSSLCSAGSDGHYWSSSLNSYSSYYAYYLYFNSGNVGWGLVRDYGQSVRAVCP